MRILVPDGAVVAMDGVPMGLVAVMISLSQWCFLSEVLRLGELSFDLTLYFFVPLCESNFREIFRTGAVAQEACRRLPSRWTL